MKTFQKMAAQGDMLIRRIDKLPDNISEAKPEDGLYILAHSETGHHHAVKAEPSVKYYTHANDNLIAYLVVDNEAVVEHMRDFDTHEPIKIDNGIFEIRRQREYTFEGFRRVAD